jgi:ricin-type beta-trefoil lectin protein
MPRQIESEMTMRALFRTATLRVVMPSIGALFAAGIIAGILVLFPAPPANALADQRIFNDRYDRCLDVDDSSPIHNGTVVRLRECTGRNNQAWTWYNDGMIKSSHDSRCLDLDLGYPGPGGDPVRVQVWDCHGGKNQKWVDGWAPGQILSAYNDRALEANHPGDSVEVWFANRDHNNQYWSCDCRVPYPSRW